MYSYLGTAGTAYIVGSYCRYLGYCEYSRYCGYTGSVGTVGTVSTLDTVAIADTGGIVCTVGTAVATCSTHNTTEPTVYVYLNIQHPQYLASLPYLNRESTCILKYLCINFMMLI